MPWYYVTVSHGPGHQSQDIRWLWRDHPVPIKTSEDILNLVDGEFDPYMEWPIYRVKRVRKLPAKVRENMMVAQQHRIDHAHHMLKVLQDTPAHPDRCDKEARKYPDDDRLAHIMSRCNREYGHRGKCDGRYSKLNTEKFGRY